ncbi:cobalamin-dependent protein [Ilumatobacter coccineus]|jgi:MerR family transcriptional regulator, light-induced transcriptional regulator|uniref:Putative corrinoid protein n=1 Tax=Ilumatobacter coccineus (strain NBRC 103263 / KCTC 29153 / YM16-304) TaxID=1313172 RepID=A0A6C7EA45_ILUCY|nr:cobalamin-dependent protein [Ilumatobacter coccineus]BAN03260.1 putative corrinoid protein [Ilumatobacter coccineus YM16-304]
MATTLTLHEAAEELGVHYMTAYRYVRLGLLDAEKVGGTWQVGSDAVERFRDGEQNGPVERGTPAPWAERFEARLVAADGAGAWGVVEAALAAGADLDGLYLDVVAPAMVSIGERWETGELDVAVEHAASGIVTRIMGRLGHRFSRRGRSRGTVVLGAPADETHALPVAILGDLLRLRGWNVLDLGANTPSASFVYAAKAADVVAVGISVTNSESLDSAAAACAAMKEADPATKIIVGGRVVRDGEHAMSLGADGWAANGADLHALLMSWARLTR